MSTDLVPQQSLWAVVQDLQALRDSIEGLDPTDPLYEQAKEEYRQKLFVRIRKVSGIHSWRAHLTAMKNRADQLQSAYLAARLACEQELDELDGYAKAVMESDGVKELQGEDGLKIKLKANPPSVVITDEALVPWDYRETFTPPPVEKIVKAKIAKALKAGIDVPGADLNISSTRVDWGDVKPKRAAVASVQWHSPEAVEGELE